jgi:hypothetical protein
MTHPLLEQLRDEQFQQDANIYGNLVLLKKRLNYLADNFPSASSDESYYDDDNMSNARLVALHDAIYEIANVVLINPGGQDSKISQSHAIRLVAALTSVIDKNLPR